MENQHSPKVVVSEFEKKPSYNLLQEKLISSLNILGGIDSFIKPNARVLIKPNLAIARPYTSGKTTDPRIIEVLIQEILPITANVVIGEGNLGEGNYSKTTLPSFRACGILELRDKYDIKVVDFRRDKYVNFSVKGSSCKFVNIAKTVVESDVIINVPAFKGRLYKNRDLAFLSKKVKRRWAVPCSLSLKNLKGCISDEDKMRFHMKWSLQRAIADLNTVIKSDLIVTSGVFADFQGRYFGRKEASLINLLIVSNNPVSNDSVCLSLLGWKPDKVEMIKTAYYHGLGPCNLEEINIILKKSLEQIADRVQLTILRDSFVRTPPPFKMSVGDICSGCEERLFSILHRNKLIWYKLKSWIIIAGLNSHPKFDKRKSISWGDCATNTNARICINGCPPNLIGADRKIKNFFKR